MLSKSFALILLLFQIFHARQCKGAVSHTDGNETDLETSHGAMLPDHEESKMFLLPPTCKNNVRENLKNSLKRFKRATASHSTIQTAGEQSQTNSQAKPNEESLRFVGTHECDVLVPADLAFARQAIARYEKNHPGESDAVLRTKLKPGQWMDPLWSKNKKILQAYINEVFEKINGLYARTDFNNIRLRYVPTVMTLDKFCATKHSSMLCSDEFILDTSQAVVEIDAMLNDSIPEISSRQDSCLILFLASKSKNPMETQNRLFPSRYAYLPFEEVAEFSRTYASIPSKFSQYSGGFCDNSISKQGNARGNISYLENHGIDSHLNFIPNDILEDVLLYRMIGHVLGHGAGSHHDEQYMQIQDHCFDHTAPPTIMSDSVHSQSANVFKSVQESFNDCTKKFVSDHLKKLQAGKTPKPKTCLKTNIEIKRTEVQGKKTFEPVQFERSYPFEQSESRNGYGEITKIFEPVKKYPVVQNKNNVVTGLKLPIKKKQVETLVQELEKSYPFKQSKSRNGYGKIRKLIKRKKSADLKSVWDLVQKAVDAGFSIRAKDPEKEKLLASSVSPEHSLEGVKTAFYYWHTVYALKEFVVVSDRLNVLMKRIESDCEFLREAI